MIKIKKLGPLGHETLELTIEEAQQLTEAEEGRYVIIDAQTRKILKEVKLEDGQELYMVPVIRGGS